MKPIGDVISESQSPDKTPTKREQHDTFVNAIIRGITGREYDPENPPTWSDTVWAKLHRLAKWYMGQDEKSDFPPPANASPENIILFHDWYKRTYPNISFPEAREKVLSHWANWEMAALRGRRDKGSMVAVTSDDLGLDLDRFDKPDYQPVTGEAVDELIARLKGGGNHE